MRKATQNTPASPKSSYVDSKYVEGRYSPSHILDDTIDSVEVMSTESTESIVEDRLRVLEHGPAGWATGKPRPWSTRSPVYDKPLPVPSRTPSPLPAASPVDRRERGPDTGGRTKVLFPQDAEEDDRASYTPSSSLLLQPTPSPVRMESPLLARPVWQRRSAKARSPSPAPPPQQSPTDMSSRANQLEKQQLLSAYHRKPEARGPSPLSFALSTAVKPPSLVRQAARAAQASPVPRSPGPLQASPVLQSPGPLQAPRPAKPADRPMTPFSFAELLSARGASGNGMGEGAARTQGECLKAHKLEHKAEPERQRISPGAQMIDLAERGQSEAMTHKWESRHSREFFADSRPVIAVKVRRARRARGSKSDWKTTRRYPVDKFFNPALFDETRQQEPARQDARPAPPVLSSPRLAPNPLASQRAKERQMAKMAQGVAFGPRKGRKGDWRVERRYAVDKYFVPRLFHHTASAQKIYTAGDWLRKNWRTTRRHFVDHYFNPQLFDYPGRDPISPYDWYRMDWKVERQHSPERYFMPSLFAEGAKGVGVVQSVSPSASSSQFKSPQSSPSSDAVFDRYKASTGSAADWPFYKDRTGEYDWEVDQQAAPSEQAKRQLTPSSPSLDPSKRHRQQSPAQPADRTGIWDLVISYGPAAVDHDAMVLEAVSRHGHGVPAERRSAVWLSLLGLPIMDALCQLYPDLLLMSARDNAMIEYDVQRAVDDPGEQQVLSNILHAYILYDPVVGYAPGMLNTAMLLRDELTEEQSFAGLVRVYFAWDQRRLAVPGVDGLRECLYILDRLVAEQLPEVHAHLGRHGVSMDMFAAHWFHALHIDEALTGSELFTWFLMDGRQMVYSVALGLLAMNEARLLECQDDPEHVAFILQHDIMNGVPPDTLLDYALQYYHVDEERLVEKQREFAEMRHHSLEDYADEEFEVVKSEAVKIVNSIARLSSRMLTVLGDRTRLVAAGSAGRQEVADLHKLCYEQAYRVHVDDARIVADQYFSAIDPDLLNAEVHEGGVQDGTRDGTHDGTQSEQNRIADELVLVKVEYAEALAQIDQLKAELKANERQRLANM